MIRTGAAAGLALVSLATAQTARSAEDGRISLPALTVPFSNQASLEARHAFTRSLAASAPAFGTDVQTARAHYGKFNDDRLAEARRTYDVRIEHERLNGVPVDVVTPQAGVPPANADRVLINVHGGAFMWGSGSGALLEAVPIAAVGRIKVVTVDYRLAPEHRFPAASEDVAAVYRALLKDHRPESIGIYGCSAGGIITAQAVAWFQAHGLPAPGAIGTFCGTGAPYGGDSAVLAGPLTGGKPLPEGAALPDTLPSVYMTGVAADNPLAYPIASRAVLAKFPPTLHLAGSRDFAASTLTTMHRKLSSAGVESELFLFDGMGHAFFMWPDLPESREAYEVITRFFDRRLGRGKQ